MTGEQLQTEKAQILDWRKMAPEQRFHECDCSHCEVEIEPIQWPMLIPVADGDVPGRYITDKYLAIRADLAPIPEGYEGAVYRAGHGPAVPDRWRAAVTSDQPTGVHFRHQIIDALSACGWSLRRLNGDPGPHDQAPNPVRLYAVVTAPGEHIGWALSSTPVAVDDEFTTAEWTKPYAPSDISTPPGPGLQGGAS